MKWIVVVMLVVACNGFDLPAQPRAGAHPISNAGTGSSFPFGTTIDLDGSRSFDPDGGSLEYRWSVASRPAGSTAEPVDARAVTTTFTPDRIGTYRLELLVIDADQNGDTSELRLVSTGAITSVDAGLDGTVPWLGTAALSGIVTTMPGFYATYSWRFVSSPAGSTTAIVNASTLTPTFMADAAGTYIIALDARVGDEVREDTVAVVATSPGISLGNDIVAYTYTNNTNRLLYAHDVGHAELVALDPTTLATATANLGNFTPRSITMDDTDQTVGVGGAGVVAIASASNLFVIGARSIPGCSAAEISLPTQSYRMDCFPVDGTVEPIRSSDANGVVTEIPCPVKSPHVALSPGGYMYMVDGASSEFYLYDSYSTPALPVISHGTVPGSAPPVIPAGGSLPYALTGNGVAINLDHTVRYDLQIPISAGVYAPNGEIGVVSGTLFKVFGGNGIAAPTLKLSIVLPSVNGEAPIGRFVAFNYPLKRFYVIASTSAGDVLYTVQR